MIGRLSGVLIVKQPPALLLDVNGVGYDIDVPMSTFYVLPNAGEQVVLLIHTHVREDALQLYGFASESERNLFRALIKVSGIGAKLALTILSGIEVQTFIHCVHSEDSSALTRLPGVGKKTAQRLIVEMKDRLEHVSKVVAPVMSATQRTEQEVSPIEEAVSALIALGYKAPEASKMVAAVQNANSNNSAEDLIKNALKAAIK